MTTGHLIDSDGKFVLIIDGSFDSLDLTGNLTVGDDSWIGLGAAKGRIEFDDQAIDEINFLDCRVGIGTTSPNSALQIGDGSVEAGQPELRIYGNESGTPKYTSLSIDNEGHLEINNQDSIDINSNFFMLDGKIFFVGINNVDNHFDISFGRAYFGYAATGGFAVVQGGTNKGIKLIVDGTGFLNGIQALTIVKDTGCVGIGTGSFGASMVGGMAIANNTAPSGDVANQHAYFSADFAAGNAAPYFRTENGTVIGLNQSLLTTDNVTHNRLALTGGFKANLVTKTGAYTATADDYTILCDASGGSFTITLPAVASHANRIYNIKKIDSSANAVTVDGNSSETIDDSTTAILTTQYESITIQSDGSEWWIL